MLTNAQMETLEEMANKEAIASARTAYEKVCLAREQNAQAVEAAERALAAAQAARSGLLATAASGAETATKTIQQAAQAVRDAEARLAFLNDLAATLEAEWTRAHGALTNAQGLAYEPVMRHGRDLRLAAAGKLDAARNALREAEGEYDAASLVVGYALARGYAPKRTVQPGRGTHPLNEGSNFPIRHGAEAEAALWADAGLGA